MRPRPFSITQRLSASPRQDAVILHALLSSAMQCRREALSGGLSVYEESTATRHYGGRLAGPSMNEGPGITHASCPLSTA